MNRTRHEGRAVRQSLAKMRQAVQNDNAVGLSYQRIMTPMRPWRVVWRERTAEGKIRRFPGVWRPTSPGNYMMKMVDTYIDAFCRLVHVVERV